MLNNHLLLCAAASAWLLVATLLCCTRPGSCALADWATEGQRELMERHPGSEKAVARALKMAIVECQFQARHDPWNCPVYNISARPSEVFGKLMLHNFKESSFVRSLLSAAIAHSVARACTESRIPSCESSFRDGVFRENVEFGKGFARHFMEAGQHQFQAAHLHQAAALKSAAAAAAAASLETNTIERHPTLISNDLVPHQQQQVALSQQVNSQQQQQQQYQQQHLVSTSANANDKPLANLNKLERELRIRSLINAHNDKLGRNHVERGMSRACKCHGLSGACTTHTCWLKLPPFKEVAKKLHDTLYRAVRILPQVYSAAGGASPDAAKRHPVARSIRGARSNKVAAASAGAFSRGALAKITPKEEDLLYLDESPDFCLPNPAYNIKGTKGRVCSEDPGASNSCRQLCCGRGYKKEMRLESYKCECHFRYCCYLDCKTCTSPRTVYKCL